MTRTIMVLACCILFGFSANAQDTLKYKMKELTVTAKRMPVALSESARSIQLIESSDLNANTSSNPVDLLQLVSGLDLKQRGMDGIQADVSVRGGTFEQTLIMIDGIPVNDPQTGHHNMNLPFTLLDVERVEILKGQGSKSFGPNAFSGAVNFITKSRTTSGAKIFIEGGDNGYYNTTLNGTLKYKSFSNSVTYQKQKSDGYIHNTNFDSQIFTYQNSFNTGNLALKGMFGYADKKFGANSFYTTRFPNQWEHTITKFGKINAIYSIGKDAVELRLFYRRNEDEFLLNYENPSFYKNNHSTNMYGAIAQYTMHSSMGETALGFQFLSDDIKSNNLGEHSRNNKGLFIEHLFSPTDNLNLTFGGFVYNYDLIGWKIWPGFDVNYSFGENYSLFASIGKAFRVPSYTDLYYNDPATEGNADLESEETLNSEIGLKYISDKVFASVAFFNNDGKNIIDWIRLDPSDKWKARNITRVKTNGVEFELNLITKEFIPFVSRVSLGYTYLVSDKKDEEFDSRYALEYLRNQATLSITNDLPFDVKLNWFFRYEDRYNFEDAFITDLKLSRKYNAFTIHFSAINLFDIDYMDVNGVRLPNRWIRAGLSLDLY